MEDTEFSAGMMNGEKAESGRFAGSLRRKLMREHLGLDSDRASHELIQDCVSDTFWYSLSLFPDYSNRIFSISYKFGLKI